MNKKVIFLIFINFFFTLNNIANANQKWILDKEISSITFEIPVLLLKNVKGSFQIIDGIIEIDTKNKKNNKALFSVNINSIEMNYKEYIQLILSDIFFNEKKFPIALIDTKKFSYKNEKKMDIVVELSIKGIVNEIPIQLKINNLSTDFVQIKANLIFSRKAFNIGTGNWSSTAILKDKVEINANLFLYKE